jgi:putative beta-barrel porin
LKFILAKYSVCLVLVMGLLLCGTKSFGQLPPANPMTASKTVKDTSKTNTDKWKDEAVNITYEKLNSAKTYIPDSALHSYHRLPFVQPWYRDLGNVGSPVNNLFFTPENRLGPTLGYHVFDVYRFNPEDLDYFTTSRPYSVFTYELGSKLEQTAGLMHTQNVKPNWNFAFDYRKTNSPGFYQVQRNNHDNVNLTTNYKSLDKHYSLYAAVVYNKEQHDENGGILDSELTSGYSDRKTIDAAFQDPTYSTTRSSVSNVQRDFTLLLKHSYVFGKTDTTYSTDSTKYTYKVKPVFGLTHKMEVSTEKHTFKDVAPDSLRYTNLFQQSFINNGSGYYAIGGDSVITQQKWFWIDNQVLLNGFVGNADHPLQFSAGLGNRYDQFISQPEFGIVSYDTGHHPIYGLTADKSSIVSNYVVGEIKKEAMHPGEWEYGANTKFFLTGQDAGNFVLNASMGRELKNNTGSFVIGFQQQVNSAPYAYTHYENNYTSQTYNYLNTESVSLLYASIESPRYLLSGGVRNYVIGNYIYLNDSEKPAQYTIPFSITQAWIRKTFRVGVFFLDNEVVYQQIPVNAPVNIPAVMGRHQLSYERSLFKRALKVAAGVEVRYNTAYHPAGYDAILNRFFYQNAAYYGNMPEASVFFNFRIKRFRAFIIGDNLQQLITHNNTVLFVGNPVTNLTAYIPGTFTPVYAAPDALIRFGFTWVMVN